MKSYMFLTSCLLLSSVAVISKAQKTNMNLEQYFATVDKYKQFNGGLLLAKQGRAIWQHASGYADRSQSVANASSSQFNLASISKPLTSTAVLQLRDMGKLKLCDPVANHLNGFPFKNVTIRHLLTHTSGLPDLELYESLIKQYPDTIVTNGNILPELRRWTKGLYFEPGDQFRYCNTEYSLLALVIEEVSHRTFQEYMRKNVFVPAGMKDSYIQMPCQSQTGDRQMVKMYERARRFTDTAYVNVDSLSRYKYTHYNCSGTVGESGVISSLDDMMRFDHAFFSGKLLKQSSITEVLTPLKLNDGSIHQGPMDTMQGEGKGYYGLGWAIIDQPGIGRSVGHGGFKFGLATYYLHHISDGKTIFSYDNSPGPSFGQITTATYHHLNGRSVNPFQFKRSLAIIYGNTLVKEGPDMAISKLNQLKSDTVNYFLSEWEMDKVGGELFFGSDFTGHKQLGLEAFKVNTLLFPEGFNTYDSYGEGLRLTGNKQAAILEYQKSVTLNPKNEGGKRALKEMTDNK